MSWAGDLKAYETQKQTVPEAFRTAEPVRRITKGAGASDARQYRDFNIVSNTAPTAERESAFRQARDAQQSQQRERAVAKQMQSTQHNYNIITMKMNSNNPEEPVRGNQEFRGKLVGKDGNTFSSTAKFALETDAWISPPPSPRTVDKNEKKLARVEAREREYNIVTQEYRVGHDAKAERDRALERQRVNAAAMQSTDFYNPITCKYRHLDDEMRAQSEEKEKSKIHRVPKCIAVSDGGSYDIVSNEPIKVDQTEMYDKKRWKGIGARAERRKEWEQLRDAHEVEADIQKMRSLNRVNQNRRDAEALAHGYDILSNKYYETDVGENAANPNATKPIVPLANFKPTSTIETIRLAQQKALLVSSSSSAAEGGGHANPRTSYDRLFCHPSREIAEEELRAAERERREVHMARDRVQLAKTNFGTPSANIHFPQIGSGVIENGWDPQSSTYNSEANKNRPAGGAANSLDKNEMGKSGVRKTQHCNHDTFNTTLLTTKEMRSAGSAGGNITAKSQLKPLVTVDLMAKKKGGIGEDGVVRSFF